MRDRRGLEEARNLTTVVLQHCRHSARRRRADGSRNTAVPGDGCRAHVRQHGDCGSQRATASAREAVSHWYCGTGPSGFRLQRLRCSLTECNGRGPYFLNVMTLRRFSGFLMAIALVQLTLARTPLACASQSAEPSSTAPSHAAMSMTGETGSPMTVSCDACDSASEHQPPCGHSDMSGCATMTSCTSTPVEGQSPPMTGVAPSSRVVTGIVLPPAATSSSPETPPPRV